jgi:predicted MFS family arabinose efflux permease
MFARVGLGLVAAAGLFVLAGATPAALGMLADISEEHPDDRGAIMGLYSVFLAVGQIAGAVIGGLAADIRGIDAMFVATLVLLVLALGPLAQLRRDEHYVGGTGGTAMLDGETALDGEAS